MKQRIIYKDNPIENNNTKPLGLYLPTKLSIKQKLTIGITTATLGLLTLALTIFPTANQLANALTINSLSQTSGSVSGGNEITIKGEGFQKDEYYLGEKIKQVATSNASNYVLIESGRVFAWGLNNRGQLGLGDTVNRTKPVEITDKFGNAKISRIVTSAYAAFFLTDNGQLFGTGANHDWHLISDEVKDITNPVLINSRFGGAKMADVAASFEAALYLTTDGRVYFAGSGDNVPYDIGETSGGGDIYYGGPISKAMDITSRFGGEKIAKIGSNIVVTESGRIYAWGRMSLIPELTKSGKPIDITDRFKLAASEEIEQFGYASNLQGAFAASSIQSVLTNNGRVFTWGNGKDVTDVSDKLGNAKAQQLVGANGALTTDGDMYVWGKMEYGSAGNGQEVYESNGVLDSSLVSFDLTNSHTIRAYKDGTIVTTGSSWGGLLGVGDDYGNEINLQPFNISANFGTLSKSRKVNNIKSIKFGNTEAKFTIIDNDTIRVTVPASINPGKVAISITDNDGKIETLNNAYEYVADKGSDNSAPIGKNNNHVIPVAPNTGAIKAYLW